MVSLILSVTIVVLFFSPNTEVLLIVMLCFSRFLITLQVSFAVLPDNFEMTHIGGSSEFGTATHR
jgi:hypothetical protein